MKARLGLWRYRLRLFGVITGRWWPTRELAEESALRKGLARRDPKTGAVNLAPGLAIEAAEGPGQLKPRGA